MKTNFLIVFALLLSNSLQLYSQSSVLANGNWYKIAVAKEGIYCLTYTDLSNLGLNMTSIDPRNISLFGNPAGILPVANNVPHADDLQQMRIVIKGENDGVFDIGDSLFFYGQSSVERKIKNDSTGFYHVTNIYCDSVYYFLTIGISPGLRIQQRASLPTFTNSISKYTDFEFHEYDSVNFLHSGKLWYGEEINLQRTVSVNFDLTNISNSDSAFLNSQLIGRSAVFIGSPAYTSTVIINYNNLPLSRNFSNVGSSVQDNYGTLIQNITTYPSPTSNGIIEFNLTSNNPDALCWLDFVEMNFTRELKIHKTQQFFCDLNSISPNSITQYNIADAPSSLKLWDVTDPLNVSEQLFNQNFPLADFNANNDSPHTYIAFDGTHYLNPTLLGQIPNQNLHAISQANMIIITHKDFYNEALTLGNFHQTHDGLNTVVVKADEIYNEYSTGVPDITGIRDFIRQVYFRSATANDSLKYLLLFGDASYDYRNRLGLNSGCIPTLQSAGSINLTQTYCNDGFFAAFADNATDLPADSLYISVGRLPVRNVADANVIHKIINYSTTSTLGSWRKKVLFVADDEDFNTHLKQMDTLANRVENETCDLDINKIYVDAYVQDTVGVHSYPEARTDLINCINNGSLVIEYTGHGGILGWAQENIIDTTDIQNFNNSRLPLFLGTTSEMNNFDDPAIRSAGEMIAMNDSGAGIASIGMCRLAFSSSNFNLLQKLHKYLFQEVDGKYNRLGDLWRKAKNDYLFDPYVASLVLLGDPAVRLIHPEYDVITTVFNGNVVSGSLDTISPGQPLHIAGEINDYNGNAVTNYNGIITLTLFNQKTLHHTLGNDPLSQIMPFYEWDDTLRSLDISVNNGLFDTTFIVPWVVDSGFGIGKISYYAQDGTTDASGCYINFIFRNLTPGIDEYPDGRVIVFPNPSSDKIIISIEGIILNDFKFTLFDFLGQVVRRIDITDKKTIIEKGDLSSGMYLFVILDKENKILKIGKLVFE